MQLLDFHGRSGEFFSSYMGNGDTLATYLAKEGADPRGSSKNGDDTAAHFACYGSSNVNVLQQLKANYVDLFKLNQFKRSPLMVAASSGKFAQIDYLVNHVYKEAKRNPILELDVFKRSVLHSLCSLGSSENEKGNESELAQSLRLFLSYYKDDEARKSALKQIDKFGYTPVQLAIANGYTYKINAQTQERENTELASIFNEYGINVAEVVMPVNEISRENRDFFLRTELMVNAFAGSVENVKQELAQANINPNQANAQFGGRNALHLSCCGISGAEHVKAILEHPATDVQRGDFANTNALMFAANSGRLDTFQALIEGVTVEGTIKRFAIEEHINDLDARGFSVLDAAIMASSRAQTRAQIIQLLIVEYNIAQHLIDNALELAQERNNSTGIEAINAAVAQKLLKQEAARSNLTNTYLPSKNIEELRLSKQEQPSLSLLPIALDKEVSNAELSTLTELMTIKGASSSFITGEANDTAILALNETTGITEASFLTELLANNNPSLLSFMAEENNDKPNEQEEDTKNPADIEKFRM